MITSKASRSLQRLLPFFFAVALLVTGARATEAKAGIPRLIDLGADKCIPCKLMMPVMAELTKEYQGQLEVVFIDVWKDRDAGKPYGIQLIPTQIFYDASGKERFRHEGFMAKKDILAKWKELGIELKAPASLGKS